jgi:hypothetical protein
MATERNKNKGSSYITCCDSDFAVNATHDNGAMIGGFGVGLEKPSR